MSVEPLVCPYCPRKFEVDQWKSEPWRSRLYHCWIAHQGQDVSADDLERFLADKQRRDHLAGRLV